MKTLLIIVLGLFFLVGCSHYPTDEGPTVSGSNENRLTDGSLTIRTISSSSSGISGMPLPVEPTGIFLTIAQISVHKADNTGWVTIADTEVTIDFLQLVNGVTAELAEAALEPGDYTQLRLVVAETNEVIVDGESNPLVVPSGVETGVKLNLGFTIVENQETEIVVDFDVTRSVIWTEMNYLLRPAFNASLNE